MGFPAGWLSPAAGQACGSIQRRGSWTIPDLPERALWEGLRQVLRRRVLGCGRIPDVERPMASGVESSTRPVRRKEKDTGMGGNSRSSQQQPPILLQRIAHSSRRLSIPVPNLNDRSAAALQPSTLD